MQRTWTCTYLSVNSTSCSSMSYDTSDRQKLFGTHSSFQLVKMNRSDTRNLQTRSHKINALTRVRTRTRTGRLGASQQPGSGAPELEYFAAARDNLVGRRMRTSQRRTGRKHVVYHFVDAILQKLWICCFLLFFFLLIFEATWLHKEWVHISTRSECIYIYMHSLLVESSIEPW